MQKSPSADSGIGAQADEPRFAYALALAYDGAGFSGWQVQPGMRTVQGELETALERFFGRRVTTLGAGRTDAGVHALGQAARFAAPREYPEEVLLRALEATTPPDMRLFLCRRMPGGFNPRREALDRTYRYLFHPGDALFWRTRALCLPTEPDWAAVEEAAPFFEGRRDFAAVGGAVVSGGSTVRTVHRCRLEQCGGLHCLEITADAFLYRMVRTVAGCLLAVGRGKLRPDDLPRLLYAGDRAAAPTIAPAHGLYLTRVRYERFDYTPDPGPVG